MFDELDPVDDILVPPVTTTDRTPGKFRPKARAKPAKVASATPRPSDATQLVPPLEPAAPDLDPKLERPCLQPCDSNSCSVVSGHHSTQESVQQSKVIIPESAASEGENLEHFQQNQGNLDTCFSLDSPSALSVASGKSGPVDGFQTKADSQPEATHFEINVDQQPSQAEPSIHSEASQGGGCTQGSDIDMQPNLAKSKKQALAELSIVGSPDDLFHPSGTTEEPGLSDSAGMGSSTLAKHQVDHETLDHLEGSCHEDQLFNAEKEVVSMCGQENSVEGADMYFSMNPHDDNFHRAFAIGIEETVEDTNHGTTGSDPNFLSSELNATLKPLQVTKELPAPESIDDGLEVSLSDGDLQAFPDDPQEVEMEVLSGLESLNSNSVQHNNSADVRQLGKFQPKKNKSQSKGRTAKSVSFVLPDSSNSASAPVEYFSETMDPYSLQAMTDRPVDDSLRSDCNGGLQMDHQRMGDEDGVENGLLKVLEDIHTEPLSQDVQELNQQIQEGRTTSENEDAGASKPSRKLRKRIAKCGTDEIDGRSNDDWHIDNFNVSQMDDSQSDDGHSDEDMPKPKRAKRKSKKQTTEIEKPTRRRKKVSEKSDSAVEDSPEKKFPHGTRRKRRQVNKVLLQTPEDEIDPRQISIKDLIMLAEHKERISNKEAASMSKLFSNQSTSSLSNNENTLFGEDQEPNHYDEEANHNIQPTPNKLNYHSYMNRPPTVRWSKSETELLYEAIRQFGTDFAMIQQLFPNRTRHQVKLKFKIEERKHPLRVHDALLHPSKDRSHVMQVIKQLQSRAEATSSNGETNGDQVNKLQDGIGKNEEGTGDIQDEEQQQIGCDGEVRDPEEFNDSKGEVNEYESLFEWDSGTYPEDAEKDMFWEI